MTEMNDKVLKIIWSVTTQLPGTVCVFICVPWRCPESIICHNKYAQTHAPSSAPLLIHWASRPIWHYTNPQVKLTKKMEKCPQIARQDQIH